MKENQVAYFLNAVHYCIWRWSRRLQILIDKVIGRFLYLLGTIISPNKYKKRLDTHVANREKDTYVYFNNRKRGFHILFANDNFGFFMEVILFSYHFCLPEYTLEYLKI